MLRPHKRLGIENNGLAFWVACIRECFEEVGVLLDQFKRDSIIQDAEKLSMLQATTQFKNDITF